MNNCIQLGCIKLIKCNSKESKFYKRFYFYSILNKCCSFKISINQIILEEIGIGFHKKIFNSMTVFNIYNNNYINIC